MRWKSDEIEDFIARADGTPTYNLAVVTDDKNMKISHVIRGEDHITNTIKQTLIYRALNWNFTNFCAYTFNTESIRTKIVQKGRKK